MSQKTTTGRIVAAVGGILLIISLFLTWAGSSVPDQVQQFAQNVNTTFNAFDLFGFMPFVFLLIGVLALLPAALDIFNLDIELPFDNSLVAVIGGVLAIGSMLLVLDSNGSAKFGVWLAFLAAIAITVGGFMQMNESEPVVAEAAAPPPAGYAAPAPAAAPPQQPQSPVPGVVPAPVTPQPPPPQPPQQPPAV